MPIRKQSSDSASSVSHTPQQRGRRFLKIFSLLFLALFGLGGWGGTAYYYEKYRTATHNTQTASEHEATRLLMELQTLIELPQGELPSIATITDITRLAQDPFFLNAQNGDALIVYQSAQTAYLYRSREKKIINVGTFMQPAAPTAETPE